ncbi:MAG TPA: hypothetical protein VFY12_03360 [Arenimonas sp.]|nr:hypothetical protein [Arenimonas sp.]
MPPTHATFAELRALVVDVLRYLWRLFIDSIRDLVRIPLAILRALLSLLSANGKPTREALLILLLDSLREMVLIPIVLAAAALDVLLAFVQAPRYFHASQQLGRRWGRLLDRWFVARSHARRMRVLKRWYARRQQRRDEDAALP